MDHTKEQIDYAKTILKSLELTESEKIEELTCFGFEVEDIIEIALSLEEVYHE